jgi:hypothetical protein
MSERLIAIMNTSSWPLWILISFIRAAMCIHYRAWPAMIWLAPFLSSVEMGGWFQPADVPFRAAHFWGAMRAASLDVMGLNEDNNCPIYLAGYSALSCLVPSITSLLLVASSSIWFKARQLILSKSLRHAKFEQLIDSVTLGMRILSMVMGFLWNPYRALGHTSLLVHDQVVHRCLSLAYILYCIRGLLLSFLVEYSYKGNFDLTHLFV